jgi:hypothetical protein
MFGSSIIVCLTFAQAGRSEKALLLKLSYTFCMWGVDSLTSRTTRSSLEKELLNAVLSEG